MSGYCTEASRLRVLRTSAVRHCQFTRPISFSGDRKGSLLPSIASVPRCNTDSSISSSRFLPLYLRLSLEVWLAQKTPDDPATGDHHHDSTDPPDEMDGNRDSDQQTSDGEEDP